MERIKTALLLSFRTKVIVPVVAVMILLLAASMWLVDRQVTRQIQGDAAQMLLAADAMLKKWQETRAKDFSLRFYNIVKESRIQAVAKTGDPGTFRHLLDDLIGENAADVMVLSSMDGNPPPLGATDGGTVAKGRGVGPPSVGATAAARVELSGVATTIGVFVGSKVGLAVGSSVAEGTGLSLGVGGTPVD